MQETFAPLVVEIRHLVPCFRLWAGKMPELAMCARADQCPLLSNSVQNIAPQRMQRCAKNDQSHLCARSPFLRLLIPNLRTLYPGNVLLLNNVR